MKSEQYQVKKAAEDIGANVNTTKSGEAKNMLGKIVNNASSPKDAMGLTDAMVEGIYGQAYRLYNTGKYRDAIQLFRLLIMLNPTESKYTLGLAACFHMLKEYKAASDAYCLVSVVDAKSPIPFYHASDCFIQMGDNPSAIIALQMAVERAGDNPAFKTLKDRALLTIESLQKQMNRFLNKS